MPFFEAKEKTFRKKSSTGVGGYGFSGRTIKKNFSNDGEKKLYALRLQRRAERRPDIM